MAAALTGALLLGGLTWPGQASAAVGVPQTYEGHVVASTVTNPNKDKPQSKLWHHAGSWWALMVEAGGTSVRIHELMSDHTWRNTGALVDTRTNSSGDALWSERDNRLYVASRAGGSNLKVVAFSFDSTNRSWVTVQGFPVSVSSGGGSESATIDQDSLGNLWVTYTRGSRLWVAHSTDANHSVWTAGFEPNVGDTVISSDDISALIAFNASIGLLWSDQESGVIRFAIHADGAADSSWQVETVPLAVGMADDHLNIKQLVGDSQGRIFAAIKTSADQMPNPQPNDTLVGVLTRTPGADGTGVWDLAPAGTLAQEWTRPIIMIDATNQELYFFAGSDVGGGDIIYKKSRLDDVSFPTGDGQPFVDASFPVNNPSGAKDPATSATGLVILADSKDLDRYAHAEMELAGGGGPVDPVDPAPMASPSPANGATGVPVTENVTAAFSEDVSGVDGSSFTLRPTSGTGDIPAAVTYDATTQVATLDPADSLAAGTSYTATLSGAIVDSGGNSISPNPTTWSFTTAPAPEPIVGTPPTVTARAPAPGATNVARSINVTATFSEPVTGVDATTFMLTNLTTQAAVAAVVSRNGTTNQWILNPKSNLAPDTRYRATLTTGIRDAEGTALAATETWEFVVGPAPRIVSKSPAAGATGVSRAGDIAATFSEPVLNVTNATFTVGIGTGPALAGVVTRNGTTNQWILNPDATLAANTKYTVTVTGGTGAITDAAGNPLKTVKWTFTTGAG